MRNNRVQKWLAITLSATLPWGGAFMVASPSFGQIPRQLQESPTESPPLPDSQQQETPTESSPLPNLQQQETPTESSPASPAQRERRYRETPYTLGSGDGVAIEIFNVPEYSGNYRVSVEGTLNLPIVGSVDVEGLTIPEANEVIQERYQPILQRPIVTLTLAERRPIRIALAGEVNRPGTYNVSGEGGQFPPITEAIQQAGGLTRSADAREIKLRREINGEQRVLDVNLWELVDQGDVIQDVTLRDGDTIFIPTAEENIARETRQLSRSTLAPVSESVEVAIVGEVNRPGPHTVGGGDTGAPPTITQAIREAGGITNLSDIRNVEVKRETRTGTEEVIAADLWNLLQQGDVKQDIILQPGDTVVVPKAEKVEPTEAEALASASFSPETIGVNIIGEARNTGRVELPSNTPLSQAILASGGFDEARARQGRVELMRLNPDGTVTRREVEVDLDKGIDTEDNPPLRDGDVIVVQRSTLTSVSDTVSNILRPISTIFQGIRFFDIFFGN